MGKKIRKKKNLMQLCAVVLCCIFLAGCGGADNQTQDTGSGGQEEGSSAEASSEVEEDLPQGGSGETAEAPLADGVYEADFNTDSTMFHVNEACEGKGTLTVADGEMTIHISLASKNIVNLFPGLAEDAEKEGAVLLEPTVDPVTYSDGTTEEVYGFDVPVPAIGEEFDLAIVGTKGKWYDHKVSVSDPVEADADEAPQSTEASAVDKEDGEYTVDVTMEGGSGRASIDSPAVLLVKEGKAYARIQWSSPYYDYMKVGDETYLPVNTEGNSVFEIPVLVFDGKMAVSADTTAMSVPHEIEYTLVFDSASIQKR